MNKQNPPTLIATSFFYNTLYKAYKYALISLAALTCAFGAFAFISQADEKSNYLPTSPLTAIFNTLIALDVILAVLSLIYFRKASKISPKNKTASYFRLLPVAAATYVLVTLSTGAERGALDILLMITAALTVLFCISGITKLPDVLSVCAGYGQVLFGILIVVKTYLDASVEMNAPAKLLIQFAAIFMSFSVLSDIRLVLGRSNSAAFAGFKALTVCLCPVTIFATSVLPSVSKEYICYSIFLVAYAICDIAALLSGATECHDGDLSQSEENLG